MNDAWLRMCSLFAADKVAGSSRWSALTGSPPIVPDGRDADRPEEPPTAPSSWETNDSNDAVGSSDDVRRAPPRAGIAAGKDTGDPLQFGLQLPSDAGELGQGEAAARREVAIDGDRGSPPHLTGSLPPLDYERYRYPSVALTAGEVLRLPPGTLPPEVVDLVNSKVLVDPANRPSVGQVHAALMRVRAPIPAPVPRPTPERPAPSGARGRRVEHPARQGTAGAQPCRRGGTARPRHPLWTPARQAAKPHQGRRQPMTAHWRCAVCEGVNADGRTCAACGGARTCRGWAETTVLEQVERRRPSPASDPTSGSAGGSRPGTTGSGAVPQPGGLRTPFRRAADARRVPVRLARSDTV